jgi:hypothetical protein
MRDYLELTGHPGPGLIVSVVHNIFRDRAHPAASGADYRDRVWVMSTLQGAGRAPFTRAAAPS